MAQNSQQATVAWSRSFDHHVHLVLDSGTKGWAPITDPFVHGIAAACQAAGKKVWMTYTSFDPNGLGGAGVFYGVQFALDKF